MNTTTENKATIIHTSTDNESTMLYHYTCGENANRIIKDMWLHPSCSQLKAPDVATYHKRYNPKIHGYEQCDQNRDYKPVIWLTTDTEPIPVEHGLSGGSKNKCEYRFGFKMNDQFESWKSFADRNDADEWWRTEFERDMKHDAWYVHEGGIDLNEQEFVIEKVMNGIWIPLDIQSAPKHKVEEWRKKCGYGRWGNCGPVEKRMQLSAPKTLVRLFRETFNAKTRRNAISLALMWIITHKSIAL